MSRDGTGPSGSAPGSVLTVGSAAPDLELPDTHGTPVRLRALRGGSVVLVFFPFAFSQVCTREVGELQENIDLFRDHGARVLGISCDPVFSLRAWAEAEGLDLELLSDFWPHGEVARRYGVLDRRSGHARRGSFLIDGDGVLRWSVVSAPGAAREISAYRAALAGLSHPEVGTS